MKKKSVLLINVLVVLALALAACGQSSSNGTSGTDSAQSGTSLSQVNMLLVGTLKLESTAQAVTADQATKLLPLWQAYLSLSNSQTAAEAEVQGLLKQIESSMTSDQVQAIEAMNLTTTDMMDMMQSMGGMGPQGTPNPKSTPGADFPGGAFTGGNFPPDMQPPSGSSGDTTNSRPSGGGAMPGGPVIVQGGPGMGGDTGSVLGGGQVLQGTPDPSMQATAQARFSTAASQVNTMLLNVLINKLEALTSQ